MTLLPRRTSLTALLGLLTACNALSGVNDFVFDGSATTGPGGASTSTTGRGGAGGAGGAGGDGGTGGALVLPGCGDGLVDLAAGEQCDDGNRQSGDGCTAECTYEPSDACPTVELHLGQTPVVFTGDTSMAAADFVASCGGTLAPEVVFLVRTAADGLFTAELVAGYAGVLWIVNDCPPFNGAELVCDDAPPLGAGFPVQPGQLLYVIIDGNAGQAGPFELTLAIQ